MRYGAWGVWLILGDSWWTCTLEVIFSWVARPCMDACMTFFLGALETYGAWWLLHVTNSGQMEGGCLLGGCLALEEHQPCWRRHWALDTIGLIGSLHGDLHLTLGQLSWWSGHVGVIVLKKARRWKWIETSDLGGEALDHRKSCSCLGDLLVDLHHLGAWHVSLGSREFNMCGTCVELLVSCRLLVVDKSACHSRPPWPLI